MTIIKNSNYDVEYYMCYYLDNDSLVNLSGVNKTYRKLLSNDIFFKSLFKEQHPELSKNKIEFKILCDFHPNNCWKVACCAFSKKAHYAAFGKGAFKVSNSFVKEALPLISNFYYSQKDQLIAEKNELEAALKLICGSHEHDPESEINKARAALEKCQQEFMSLRDKEVEFLNSMHLVHSERDIEEIKAHYFEPNRQELFLMSDEQLEELLMFYSGNDGFLNRKLIPVYLSILKTVKEFPPETYQELQLERRNQDEKCYTLQNNKNVYGNRLFDVNLKLNLLDYPSVSSEEIQMVISTHINVLEDEFALGKDIELSFLQIPILEECVKIIGPIIDGIQEPSPELINRIRDLIKSCPHEPTQIGLFRDSYWDELYVACTGGNQDVSQWSENELAIFLLTLDGEISGKIKRLKALLSNYTPKESPL